MKKITKQFLAGMLAVSMAFGGTSAMGPAMTAEASESSARTWVVLQGGSNNAGGHNYGNGASSGPLFYTDSSKNMESGGSISMALKPSGNWGVFYSYIDDNNWLYVGHDNSSQWYYQYRFNGQESYPQISGLPEPTEGEELQLTVALNNETLEVTVNDTTVRVTNQTLKDLANSFTKTYGNLGKFGVMTKGATKISFADFTYNNKSCMGDTWVFNAERDGQTMTEEKTAVEDVTGKITDTAGDAIAGATVRVGNKSAVTAEDGTFTVEGVQIGTYDVSVSKAGYRAYSSKITVTEGGTNTINARLQSKADLDMNQYDTIASEDLTVYIGKTFPLVARYQVNGTDKFFRGNEEELDTVTINGTTIQPTVTIKETTADSKTYTLAVKDSKSSIDFTMDVKISVEDNTLTWEVTELTKNDGCAKIATIDIPELNLLTVDASEEDSVFAGAQASTTTTNKADTYITFKDGFVPSNKDGYLYAFLTNGSLSAGLHSNSEIEGDKRIIRNNGADSMSLTSAAWYYECGDKNGQTSASVYEYPVSDLPEAKVAIATKDLNDDGIMDWNDGAIAYRAVMHTAQGSEKIKDMVNYRIVMNFASMAPNPYLATADNIKKVYLATDGLPQAVMLKGYGNEGHDSANSEYADIAEREGGVEDFQDLIKIAHQYNTEIGIHVNAQEAYPEAKSFNNTMVSGSTGTVNDNGWGWLDQSVVINKLWDLSSGARLKRFVQLYDRINGTNFYSGSWEDGEYVKDSQGNFMVDSKVATYNEVLEAIKADAATRTDNMDFIYLDVWYQDAWETRRIAEEINSLGWRFSTEFSAEGEYDSTWQHWSTDASYGGASAKGYNSDIIRFLRNDQRDSQVLNYPSYGGTADNPLLGGYRLYGFEGWQGDQDFNNYIFQTFNQNLPTKFLQHYEVIKWVNYEDGKSPVGNTEKEITLSNGTDKVVVTRNEEQRSDDNIERTITLNGKVVLNDVTYLLPWTNEGETEKLYHWNMEGGTTTWELQDSWADLANVVVYELSDQGRINEKTVAVENGKLTLTAEAGVAYVVTKGEKNTVVLKKDFGECDYVVDPGFNGYADGAKLDAADWSGDITADGITVQKAATGDQRLVMDSVKEDVSVTTKISGLTKGEDYVAEIYVDNRSEAKATITVNAGKTTVSNYTEESIAYNYVQCDPKNSRGLDSKMQRIQISFEAESETAAFTLSREAGEGATYWDDIRIVNQKVDNFKADGSFEQDFESVVQGLYPFVLSSAQGVSDPCTHLSQLNAPYTQAGWNGRVIDDVISGEWSLKHHAANTGIIYQTIPQNFRFEPGVVYEVEFDYQSGPSAYQMVVGDGTSYELPTSYLEAAQGTTKHVKMEVIGSGSGQTWIGLYQNASLSGEGSMGQTDFVLDNLKIKKVENAEAVTLGSKTLKIGETTNIYGSNMDTITWTTSADGIVQIDKTANVIKAVGAGNVTLTATFASGKVVTLNVVVEDTIVEEVDREEFADISITANTQEAGGEGDVNGYASAAIDGDASTFWHTAWSKGSFTVSESNPAVLTVDLGTELDNIGGFQFIQRSNTNNGIVYQYSYKLYDAQGNVVASEDHVTVPQALQAAGAEVNVIAKTSGKVQKIEFSIESGSNGFGCLAEIAPIRVTRLSSMVFDDVLDESAYYYTPVYWAKEQGVATGKDSGKFDPKGEITRAELVTFLYRMAGEPDVTGKTHKFTDVKSGKFYEKAVIWAVNEGIATGVSKTSFAPNETVTRAQVVTFLYRYADGKDVTTNKKFSDVPASKYYYKAVAWAAETGVTSGNVDGTFTPNVECTRGQAVTFLYRTANLK